MPLQVFGHTEGFDLFLAKDGGHNFVWREELSVGWILEFVLLDVRPEPLGDLAPRQLLALLSSDNLRQLGAHLHWLGQAGQLLISGRHCCGLMRTRKINLQKIGIYIYNQNPN